MMKTRKTAVLAKIEDTYATDAAPTGVADAVLIINPKFSPLRMDLVNRELVRPFLGNSEKLPGATWSMSEFETEIAGSGVAGTPPAWGPLMRGCAMGETITAVTSVAYAPISSNEEALTIYGNNDGTLYKMLGCRGSFSLSLEARRRPTIKWQFTGLYVPVSADAMPETTLTAWKRPLPVNNANTTGFALHAYAAAFSTLSINMNVKADYRNLVGKEDVQVSDRAPSGSISIEQPTIAQKDYFTAAANATLGALTVTHGTIAGNKFKIDAANVQVTEPDPVDNNGISFLNLGLDFQPGATGNDEITFTVL